MTSREIVSYAGYCYTMAMRFCWDQALFDFWTDQHNAACEHHRELREEHQ